MPVSVLSPALDWECQNQRRVGNPFVYFHPGADTGTWRMYYSASSIWLADARIEEPLHLGLAEADDLRGEWRRLGRVTVVDGGGGGREAAGAGGLGAGTSSSSTVLGEGSLKLLPAGLLPAKIQITSGRPGERLALCNRLTQDPTTGQTGSQICLLAADASADHDTDGRVFRVLQRDLVTPSLNPGCWKHAYVYGFDFLENDVLEEEGGGEEEAQTSSFLLFYNARNGWRFGPDGGSAREMVGVPKIDLRKVLTGARKVDKKT